MTRATNVGPEPASSSSSSEPPPSTTEISPLADATRDRSVEGIQDIVSATQSAMQSAMQEMMTTLLSDFRTSLRTELQNSRPGNDMFTPADSHTPEQRQRLPMSSPMEFSVSNSRQSASSASHHAEMSSEGHHASMSQSPGAHYPQDPTTMVPIKEYSTLR